MAYELSNNETVFSFKDFLFIDKLNQHTEYFSPIRLKV